MSAFRTPRICGVACALAFFAGTSRAGEASVEESLPPAARAAFQRGIEAVQAHDWDLASRYFGEARKSAPDSPMIALNLGLAFAKAGQEPVAIAWLNAFLEADPQSPKSAAARTEAERLAGEAKRKLMTIFKAGVASAEQLANDRARSLTKLAMAEASAGLPDEAVAALMHPEIQKDSYYAGRASRESIADIWNRYAAMLIKAGNFEQAIDALDHARAVGANLTEDTSYGDNWTAVSAAFAKARDFNRAWRAAKQIPNLEARGKSMAAAAKLRFEEGDFVPAEEVLPNFKDQFFLQDLAAARLRQKDFEGAKATAFLMQSSYFKAESLLAIAEAQQDAGDANGARGTARQLLGLGTPVDLDDSTNEWEATTGLAARVAMGAYALLGEFDRGLALAPKMKHDPYDPNRPYAALGNLVYRKALSGGDPRGAVRMADTLARTTKGFGPPPDAYVPVGIGVVYAELAKAQVKLGRIDDAIAAVRIPKKREAIDYRVTRLVAELAEAGRIDRAIEMAAVLEPSSHFAADTQRQRAMRGIIHAQAAKGRGAEAEKLAATRAANVNVWIALADGYRLANARTEAVRALDNAAKAAAALGADVRPIDIDMPTWWGRKDWAGSDGPNRDETLLRIAQLQGELGDAAAAQSTRSRIRSLESGVWVKLLDSASFREDMVQLDRVLEEARASKSPDEIIAKLSTAGQAYGRNLARVTALTRRPPK